MPRAGGGAAAAAAAAGAVGRPVKEPIQMRRRRSFKYHRYSYLRCPLAPAAAARLPRVAQCAIAGQKPTLENYGYKKKNRLVTCEISSISIICLNKMKVCLLQC